MWSDLKLYPTPEVSARGNEIQLPITGAATESPFYDPAPGELFLALEQELGKPESRLLTSLWFFFESCYRSASRSGFAEDFKSRESGFRRRCRCCSWIRTPRLEDETTGRTGTGHLATTTRRAQLRSARSRVMVADAPERRFEPGDCRAPDHWTRSYGPAAVLFGNGLWPHAFVFGHRQPSWLFASCTDKKTAPPRLVDADVQRSPWARHGCDWIAAPSGSNPIGHRRAGVRERFRFRSCPIMVSGPR